MEPPVGVDFVPVESALQMHDAVDGLIGSSDVNVFAAAVSDFRPVDPKNRKMKRSETGSDLSVDLVANPDITADSSASRRVGSFSVGFALETDDLVANARKKLSAKNLDLLVANDATDPGAGFEVATNRVTILSTESAPEALPLMSKEAVAEELLDRIAARLSEAP